MRLKKLVLSNFRSYENLTWNPGPGTNLLVGPNGAGKSNLAEAIYMLATTKSHRTSKDTEVIRIGSDWCRIVGDIEREKQNDVAVEIQLAKGEKTLKVNTVKQPKISEVIGQFNVVIFSTSDVEMVKGDPSGRRRFLNLEICQTRPRYCYALAKYKRILEQRNSLLRECAEGKGDFAQLAAWDDQLIHSGAIVVEHRAEFCKGIDGLAREMYLKLSAGAEELRISYDPSFQVGETDDLEMIERRFAESLSQVRTQEISRGMTVRGPQRDDVSLSVGGMDLRYYGSRGQQRAAALAIKLAEVELIKERTAEYPVLLLDDVASELDPDRRLRALELVLGKCQAVLTTTTAADLPGLDKLECQIFEVAKGGIAALGRG